MSDDSVFTPSETEELERIQRLRLQLINDLTAEGKAPAKGQVFLLGLLDGVDRSALSRAKLRADKKRDDSMGNTTKALAELLKSVNPRTYIPPSATPIREIPADLSKRDFVPGEMHIGIEPITPKQLMGE